MKAREALGQRLALDGDRIAHLEGGIEVGAGAPDFAVGHEAAPNFAAVDQRAVVTDRDIGDAELLLHHRSLAAVG